MEWLLLAVFSGGWSAYYWYRWWDMGKEVTRGWSLADHVTTTKSSDFQPDNEYQDSRWYGSAPR